MPFVSHSTFPNLVRFDADAAAEQVDKEGETEMRRLEKKEDKKAMASRLKTSVNTEGLWCCLFFVFVCEFFVRCLFVQNGRICGIWHCA